MKKKLQFLFSLVAMMLMATFAKAQITIDTDLTNQFASLTEVSSWTGAQRYTATNFCPMVTVGGGIGQKQVCERYVETCDDTGDIFYATVTGLTAGTYTIELYGGAAYTYGRGFTSTAFSEGTWNAGDKIEPSTEAPTGVTLYATTSEGEYGGEIPIYYAQNFPDGAATITLSGVVVGTNGQVKIGMSKSSTSTNWHVIQLKSVIATVDAEALLQSLLQKAQAALDDAAYAAVTGTERTALATAISENASPEATAEAYQAAITAVQNATTAFTNALAGYNAYANAKAMVDLTAWPYASADKKAAVEALMGGATSADDGAALLKAYRQFVESNALAEGVTGAVDMTSLIVNPTAEEAIANPWTVVLGEGSGGALTILNNEPWTDGSDNDTHKYFDGGDWGKSAWDVSLTQDITLEPGRYILTAIGRASGDVVLTLFAGDAQATIPSIGAAGGIFNFGWNDQYVEFEVAEAGTVKIGVQGVTTKQYNWMSFSNFRLVQLEVPAVFDPSTAIVNAEFNPEAEPLGWEKVNPEQYYDLGMGLIGTYQVRGEHPAATVDETHPATEYAAGLECRWQTNYAAFTQTTANLPAGYYKLTFDVENTNATTTSATYENRFTVTVGENVYTDESTEWMNGKSAWTTHSIAFPVEEAAPITISLGYGTGSNNYGVGNTPNLFVSNLQLTTADPVVEAKAKALAKIAALAPVGDALFQYAQADIEAAKAAVEVATTVAEVEAVAMPAPNAPDAEKQYAFQLKLDGETPLYMNLTETGITIAEEATPLSFVETETAGQYNLVADGLYVGLAGGNAWTMSTAADNKAAWTFTALGNDEYYINNLVTAGRFVGTNAADKAAGNPCYADKQTSNGNVVWIITEYVAPTPEPINMTDLTPAMFHKWTLVDPIEVSVENQPCANGLYKQDGSVYGDMSVNPDQYADLSEWDYLTIAATGGVPRLIFNRTADLTQAEGSEAWKGTIPLQIQDTESEYLVSKDNDIYVYDLKAIKEFLGGTVHLNAIKVAGGGQMTTHAIKVSTIAPDIPTWYTITSADGIENGTVSAWDKTVEGAPVTVTATPAEGYELEGIAYAIEGEEEGEEAENGTFTMPAANVIIAASFKKAPEYIISDLTKEMFHVWTTPDAEAVVTETSASCDYVVGEETTMPYGNGSVLALQYADLSEYDILTIETTSGEPRLCLNRPTDDEQTNYVNIPNNAEQAAKYIKSKTDNKFVYDLKAIKTDYEFVHLNCIKAAGAWGSKVTVTSMKLGKLAEEAHTLYAITIAETENGTVEADVEEAEEGATVTVTVTPNDGFMVDEVSLTYGEGQEFGFDGPPTENEGVLSATFTMPAGNVNVGFTFKKVEYDITVSGATPSEEPGAYLVEGGKISISSDAFEGEQVILSLGPDEGYEVESVSVTKTADGSEVQLIQDPEHQTNWTFIMPGEAVTVTAAFKKTSVEPTPTIAATLVHTASASWGANKTGDGNKPNTVDSEAEYYNNDATSTASDKWNGAAYAEFETNLPNGATITKATLTWQTITRGRVGTERSNIVYYLNAGTQIDYEALAAYKETTDVLLYDGERTQIKDYKGKDTFTGELDVTEAVQAIVDAKQSYIIFQWTGNNASATLAGKASENAPTLVIEYIPGAPEIANWSFDENPEDVITVTTQGYARNIPEGSDQITGLQPVTGWTPVAEQTAGDPGFTGGVFAYGSENLLNNKVAAPAAAPEGSESPSALGLSAVWAGIAQYTQEATLPAGDYKFTYTVYNGVNTGAVTKNLFGFIAEDGTEYLSDAKTFTVGEWNTYEVAFTVDAETTGNISVGFIGDGGSGAAPHLFVDNVTLEKVPGIELALIELKKAIEAAEAKKATYGVGDGLFQYPASEIEPLTTAIATAQDAYNAAESKAVVEAATQTLNDAVAGFAPQATTPDPEKQYTLTLKTSDEASPFELSVSTEGIKIVAAEEGTPVTFVAQEGGTYAIFNGSEYVNYQGSDNWTMAATADAYGWAIATVEGGYTITGKNGFLGTNTSDGNAVNSPCYGDKKANNGNYIWGIAEYAEPTEKTIEIAIERIVGQGYTAQTEVMDFTEGLEFLGAESVTWDMLRMVEADGTLSDKISNGEGEYDGWFNKEGYAQVWGDNSFVCVKMSQAQWTEGQTYEICDMGSAAAGDEVTAHWALVANDKTVFYNFKVTFVEAPALELAISDVKVQKDVIYDNTFTSNYAEQKVELTDDEVQTILTELNLTSLDEAKVYGYNPSDESFVVAFAGFDGWRDANGNFATHTGTTDVPACCKYTDGKTYDCYNIAGVGDKIVKTYWAIANDEKAVLVEVDFWFGDAYTGIDGIAAGGKTMKNGRKYMENGKIFIYRNGKKFSTTGVELK